MFRLFSLLWKVFEDISFVVTRSSWGLRVRELPCRGLRCHAEGEIFPDNVPVANRPCACFTFESWAQERRSVVVLVTFGHQQCATADEAGADHDKTSSCASSWYCPAVSSSSAGRGRFDNLVSVQAFLPCFLAIGCFTTSTVPMWSDKCFDDGFRFLFAELRIEQIVEQRQVIS